MSYLISVIVPVFNTEKYLSECLESVLAQTDMNFELIVVNDGSTDSSVDIVESFIKKDDRVKLFSQKNKGLSSARNLGIKEALGEYIYFLDSDDYIHKETLFNLRSKQICDESSVVVGLFRVVSESGKVLNKQKNVIYSGEVSKREGVLKEYQQVLGVYSSSISCGSLIKKTLLVENNILFPKTRFPHEDWCFTFKVLYCSDNISILNNDGYYYRQGHASLSSSVSISSLDAIIYQYNDAQIFFKGNISLLDEQLLFRRTMSITINLFSKIRKATDSNDIFILKRMFKYRSFFKRILLKSLAINVIDSEIINSFSVMLGYLENNFFENCAPDVSVVVPIYNSDKFLEDTLNSIKHQSYPNFECLMVNDASQDGSLLIMKKFSESDSRFKIVNHKTNSGLSAARNSGARAARSKYITFLDSDDLMLSNGLAIRLNKLKEVERNPNVVGCYCGSISIKEEDKLPVVSKERLGLPDVDFVSSLGDCPFNANQPMLIRSIFVSSGGFDESLTQAEDYDYWSRLLRSGFQFVAVKYDGVTYRQRTGSMIRQKPLVHLENSLAIQNKFYQKLDRDSFYNFSINPYDKMGSEYIYQSRILPRVLAFAGMGLASGENEINVISYIKDNIGDQIRHVYIEEVKKHLLYGFKRYYSAESSDFFDSFDEKIDTIAKTLKKIFISEQEVKEPIDCVFSDRKKPYCQSQVQLVFFPHKDYHVWTISLLDEHLKRLGVNYVVVDISAHYRDEGTRRKAAELNISIISLSCFLLGDYSASIFVAFNDWDLIVRSIFYAAQSAGIKTVSIVEGIQDYEDADVGRVRNPYKSSDVVILPGRFDVKYFSNPKQKVVIGGVPRIASLLKAPFYDGKNQKKVALINSNFSYNVLVDKRDGWLKDAVCAAQKAGFDVIISRHPADLGALFPELVSGESFYSLLEKVDVVIQRFASGILESLARRKHTVYFNPHKEKVDKFKETLGAYYYTESVHDLEFYLSNLDSVVFDVEKAMLFLDEHCNTGCDDISKIIADSLVSEINDIDRVVVNTFIFKDNMQLIDHVTNVYSDLSSINKLSAIHCGKNIDFNVVFDEFFRSANFYNSDGSSSKKESMFKVANRMMREKKYGEAIKLYSILYEKNSLSIYKKNMDNAYSKLFNSIK